MSSVLETKSRAGGHAMLFFHTDGDGGDRTLDLDTASVTLSQLSYVPVMDRAGLEPASPGCKPSILPLK